MFTQMASEVRDENQENVQPGKNGATLGAAGGRVVLGVLQNNRVARVQPQRSSRQQPQQVVVWGDPKDADASEGNALGSIKPASSMLDVGDAATAVSVSPMLTSNKSYIIAVGLECGKIILYTWKAYEKNSVIADWTKCFEMDQRE